MKKFHDVILDEAGNIVSGAELYVRNNTTPFALVTLYSDDGVTTRANPVVSGTDGYCTFWTADNTLKLEVYVDGELETTITDYQHYDALDNEIKALRSVTSAADKGFYFTGLGTGSTYDLTAGGRALSGLTYATDKIGYTTSASAASTTDITSVARTLIAQTTQANMRSTGLGLGTIATFDETTAAQYRANTADKALSTDQVWASADYVALTDAATIAVDMSAGFNFSVTLADNRTLGAPTNTKNGQTGAIVITQDGTGSRTLAYHANWKFAGGIDPTLSTAAGAIDVLFYQVISSTSIVANLVRGVA